MKVYNIKIDSREPQRFINYLKRKLLKHNITVETLPVGDILIEGTGICIERKTPQDFASSIKDGRLTKQVEQMKQFPIPIVAIIGPTNRFFFENYPYFTQPQFFGAYRSLIIKHKIPVIKLENNTQFIVFLQSLLKHTEDQLEDTVVFSFKKVHKDINMNILMCVPKIGPTKAKRINEVYPHIFTLIKDLEKGPLNIKKVTLNDENSIRKSFGIEGI